MPETRYAIRDTRDGRFIGLDQNSGGYPWKPESSRNIELFSTKQQAIEYCEVLGWRRPDDSFGALSWEVVEVQPLVVVDDGDRIAYPQYDAIRRAPL